LAYSSKQATNSRQQTAASRQQTEDNRQQKPETRKQTRDSTCETAKTTLVIVKTQPPHSPSGVEISPSVAMNGRVMMLTAVSYAIIQVPTNLDIH
jgi:hypothetical protein